MIFHQLKCVSAAFENFVTHKLSHGAWFVEKKDVQHVRNHRKILSNIKYSAVDITCSAVTLARRYTTWPSGASHMEKVVTAD